MAKFCPECGTPTRKKANGGLERDTCESCGWVQYPFVSAGVGAVVLRGKAVLIVERGIHPVGLWTIPSGYVEQGQSLLDSVVREVKEETNLDVAPVGIICVRDTPREAKNDYYFCFLCEDLDPTAEPVPDGDETLQARFVDPVDFDGVNLSAYSRYVIEQYLRQTRGTIVHHTIPERPGAFIFSMFELFK